MLLPILKIYTKNLRASDWLKPSAFVMWHGCKAGTWIQITNSEHAIKIRLPCLWEMPFSCILLLSNNMISRAISCKGALEQFSKTTNCTHLVFEKFTRFLTPNFTRNHVSTNLYCYQQVVPCHLRLGARFNIRFKRHARLVGQERLFRWKFVLKTRAKPVTKTLQKKLCSELSWKRPPFFVRAVWSISLEKQSREVGGRGWGQKCVWWQNLRQKSKVCVIISHSIS